MLKMFRGAYVKRMIRMNALRKGLLGGHPLWRAIWAVGALRKMWGKVSKKGEAPITFSEPLGEGQAWALVHVPEQSKRGRGEGRKLVIGPKRKPARFGAIGPAAAVAAARQVLEAPDAARVNQILGIDAVEDDPPSRKERKRAKRQNKTDAKAQRKASAKQDAADARAAKKAGKADARSAKALRKADARNATTRTASDPRSAKRASRADTRGSDEPRSAARARAKADAKRERIELRSAARAARRKSAPVAPMDEVTDAGPLQKSDA